MVKESFFSVSYNYTFVVMASAAVCWNPYLNAFSSHADSHASPESAAPTHLAGVSAGADVMTNGS
jgi:hypothetical protein